MYFWEWVRGKAKGWVERPSGTPTQADIKYSVMCDSRFMNYNRWAGNNFKNSDEAVAHFLKNVLGPGAVLKIRRM